MSKQIFKQMQQKEQKKDCLSKETPCLFCEKIVKSKPLSQMVGRALYSKYSASQNYYYSKDINDILTNHRTASVIQFKDIITFNEDEQYLKNLYSLDKYKQMITKLTEYYKFHQDIARLFMLPITQTLNRYHDKKRRICYLQITRMLKEKEEQKQLPPNDYNKLIERNTKQFGNEQKKQDDMKERVLGLLDQCENEVSLAHSNTLNDIHNKLNDIFISTPGSVQSYFLDASVSQTMGNLSEFLNHFNNNSEKSKLSLQGIAINSEQEINPRYNESSQSTNQFENLKSKIIPIQSLLKKDLFIKKPAFTPLKVKYSNNTIKEIQPIKKILSNQVQSYPLPAQVIKVNYERKIQLENQKEQLENQKEQTFLEKGCLTQQPSQVSSPIVSSLKLVTIQDNKQQLIKLIPRQDNHIRTLSLNEMASNNIQSQQEKQLFLQANTQIFEEHLLKNENTKFITIRESNNKSIQKITNTPEQNNHKQSSLTDATKTIALLKHSKSISSQNQQNYPNLYVDNNFLKQTYFGNGSPLSNLYQQKLQQQLVQNNKLKEQNTQAISAIPSQFSKKYNQNDPIEQKTQGIKEEKQKNVDIGQRLNTFDTIQLKENQLNQLKIIPILENNIKTAMLLNTRNFVNNFVENNLSIPQTIVQNSMMGVQNQANLKQQGVISKPTSSLQANLQRNCTSSIRDTHLTTSVHQESSLTSQQKQINVAHSSNNGLNELNNLQSQDNSMSNPLIQKKSFSNCKFDNLGELTEFYKEVQKRTISLSKAKEELKFIHTNQMTENLPLPISIKNSLQKNHTNLRRIESNLKGSQTLRQMKNNKDNSNSNDISPRIPRVNKENTLAGKSFTERELYNSKRLAPQFKLISNSNQNQSDSASHIQQLTNNINNNLTNNTTNLNIHANNISSFNNNQGYLQSNGFCQHAATQREQGLSTVQKKMLYKQQVSKNSSDSNLRATHSNIETNKASQINVSAQGNNTNNPSAVGSLHSAYTSFINSFGSQQPASITQSNLLQSQFISHQNSSKKIIEKIKHTRINSMNAPSVTLIQQSKVTQQPPILGKQLSSEQAKTYQQPQQQQTQMMQPQQQHIFLNGQNKKKIYHKYNKSETDSLPQYGTQTNVGVNLEGGLGNTALISSNKSQLVKQMAHLQASQSQHHLQTLHTFPQQQPQHNQFEQQHGSIQGQESKRGVLISSQTSMSPQRRGYTDKKNSDQQQFFTYANNNIGNIFVNNQENGNSVQQNNNINTQNQNIHQNITSLLSQQLQKKNINPNSNNYHTIKKTPSQNYEQNSNTKF